MLKDRRLDVRVTAPQKEMIEKAAAIQGRSVSDFTTDTLTTRAEEVIRRDRELRVSEEGYAAFIAALDEPARELEGVAALFRTPSVFRD